MELYSLHYMPPVKEFQAMLNADAVCFDTGEHFQRQTYRNRCEIYTADGLHNLVVPVVREVVNNNRKAMKDVKISYDHDWRTRQLRTIRSAYQSSAYYEYFEEDFNKLFENKFNFLVDLNLEALKIITGLMKLDFKYKLQDEYHKKPEDAIDRREEFTLNDHNLDFEYHQVFHSKKGFIANLSCIDLLFNCGPQRMMKMFNKEE
jgi:hypothetical protein